MARTHAPGRWLRIAVLAIGATLITAACEGAGASLAPSVAPATATPTAVPTPSPTPLDVSAAFVKVVTAPEFSAVGTIDGTMTIGAIAGTITGDGLFDGGDSSGTTTIAAGEFKQVTHSVTVGSDSWTRTDPGPWLLDEPSSTSGMGFDDYLQKVTTLVDLGVETRGGKQLHRLQAKGGNKATPADLGFDVGTAKDASFTVDLYATDDGTPAVMNVAGTWTTVSGAQSVPTSLDFDLILTDVGKPQTITPPTDVWTVYVSKAHGYSMAHPADWTVSSEEFRDTYSVHGDPLIFVALGPYKGSTASLVTTLKKTYAKDLGVDPTSETPTRLGGQPAVRLIYDAKNDAGQAATLVDDIISRDGTGWEVYIATLGGADDIAVFDTFVATFTFTE